MVMRRGSAGRDGPGAVELPLYQNYEDRWINDAVLDVAVAENRCSKLRTKYRTSIGGRGRSDAEANSLIIECFTAYEAVNLFDAKNSVIIQLISYKFGPFYPSNC